MYYIDYKERVLLMPVPRSHRGFPEFKTRPVIYLCSCKKEIEQMVKSSKSISKGKGVVLLFDYSKRLAARALPAYVNAAIRFAEGAARSGSMQTEMLLMMCGTMNISKALRECGAKDKGKFLVFASSKALFSRFARANGITGAKQQRLALDPKISGNVAITELLND